MRSVLSLRKKLLLLFTVLLLLVIASEIVLKLFWPYYYVTIGHAQSATASRYGWGFHPNQVVMILDPDSDAVHVGQVNNHGWRDRYRSVENRRKAFRVLVIGDSVTFGAIVAQQVMYTRLLEDRLRKAGYNAEVLNISLPGWGTDQALEALKQEGLRYKPDVVIFQFCTNDLIENDYFSTAPEQRPMAVYAHHKGMKPFYYKIDKANRIRRYENQRFEVGRRAQQSAGFKDRLKGLAERSEILKRCMALYVRWKLRRSVLPPRRTSYSVSSVQLERLELVLELPTSHPLFKALAPHQDQCIDVAALDKLIAQAGQAAEARTIKRILENYWFNRFGNCRAEYRPASPDPNSDRWQLYFGLIEQAHKATDAAGSKLAVFCTTRLGHYDWSLAWHRLSPDATSKRNFMKHVEIIEGGLKRLGIDLVPANKPYSRARNDPHQNSEGQQNMADDLFSYLIARYGAKLEAYKR